MISTETVGPLPVEQFTASKDEFVCRLYQRSQCWSCTIVICRRPAPSKDTVIPRFNLCLSRISEEKEKEGTTQAVKISPHIH
jgi:hypothetical protein